MFYIKSDLCLIALQNSNYEKYSCCIPVVVLANVLVVYELSVLSGLVSRQCRLRTNCVTPGA